MIERDMRLVYWTYNKLLWMLAGCLLLLAIWIFTCMNVLLTDDTPRLFGLLFVIAFVSFACYIWEKREFYNRQLE